MAPKKQWLVKRVVGKRIKKNGTIEYKLQWVNYKGTTWEPESNLNCKMLIRSFEEKNKARNLKLTKQKVSKSKPSPRKKTETSGSPSKLNKNLKTPRSNSKLRALKTPVSESSGKSLKTPAPKSTVSKPPVSGAKLSKRSETPKPKSKLPITKDQKITKTPARLSKRLEKVNGQSKLANSIKKGTPTPRVTKNVGTPNTGSKSVRNLRTPKSSTAVVNLKSAKAKISTQKTSQPVLRLRKIKSRSSLTNYGPATSRRLMNAINLRKNKRVSNGKGSGAKKVIKKISYKKIIPNKIIGATQHNGELVFLVSCKNVDRNYFMYSKHAKQFYKDLVFDFYESRIIWHDETKTSRNCI